MYVRALLHAGESADGNWLLVHRPENAAEKGFVPLNYVKEVSEKEAFSVREQQGSAGKRRSAPNPPPSRRSAAADSSSASPLRSRMLVRASENPSRTLVAMFSLV